MCIIEIFSNDLLEFIQFYYYGSLSLIVGFYKWSIKLLNKEIYTLKSY